MSRRAIAVSLTATALGLSGLAVANAAETDLHPGDYKLDPSHSYAHFEIDHMGLSTMHGRMDVQDGHIRIGESLSTSQVKVSLDPSSVDTGDDARDQHLREMPGFFDVEKYPKIQFESTALEIDDDDPSEATLEGRLTLHGQTRPVTLDVDHIACRVNPLDKSRYTCGFTASTEIQRSDFGMNAYPKLVGDRVELAIEVEANKPAETDS
ncbi:YceI family protein [Salinisphaera sp. SPP-AMP-43]|uniref:YceI family protein n=1 Tax=Salinisphaera sp. SPP-AMP-43 TaxID=3121288 RepID=UPI003C6DF148